MTDHSALIERLAETLTAIGGCSDGDCKVIPPRGMHTNGGCKCFYRDPMKANRVVLAYRSFVGRSELLDARPLPSAPNQAKEAGE